MEICESKSNDHANLPNNNNKKANSPDIYEKKILNLEIGRYEGEVKNGKPEGKGIIYVKNGDRYEGVFKNGYREGKGIDYYNNGDKFEGEF